MATEDYVDQAYAELHDQWNRDLTRLERAIGILRLAHDDCSNSCPACEAANEFVDEYMLETRSNGERTDG